MHGGFFSSKSERSDVSEEEGEQEPKPMVAQAPQVLERCVRIEKIREVKTSSFRG